MTSTIRQTGTGSAPAVPDVVIARIGVQTRASDVAAAFTGASAAAHAVVAAVRAAGVADGDIATTDVGLQAVETGPWEDRRLEGYAASESLTVTVRDTGRAAAVLQAA
ncbi:SIMPL domain-containing protein, partial [Tsukamurella strandjordii]|uniref:SIMPL domain-containing protein n=2 Tax=Tsukamurella TaxID=2060 RepID=UPI0039EFEC2B